MTSCRWGWPNGAGNQSDTFDNQWFRISDTDPFTSFTASSTRNAFEFDMAGGVPEPSTWAMMLVGFAGLGYAAFRRAERIVCRVRWLDVVRLQFLERPPSGGLFICVTALLSIAKTKWGVKRSL